MGNRPPSGATGAGEGSDVDCHRGRRIRRRRGYSDDFYGRHGREWVKVSAALAGESATRALVAVKVTGDPNVPAGCVTFRTARWPGVGCRVPAEIHVRADPSDPDGFSWLRGELALVAKDEIRLMCQHNFLLSEGTFYRNNDDDQGGGNV